MKRILEIIWWGLTIIVSGVFFLSFWGINAESLGKYDLGLALGLSFLVPITLYTSLAMATVSVLVIIASLVKKSFSRSYLLPLLIALLPVVFIFLVDIF